MRLRNVLALTILLTATLFRFQGLPQQQEHGNGDAAAEICRLEQEMIKFELANDPAFVEEHYADDFSGGTSLGTWETKPSIIKNMNGQQNKNIKEEIRNLKVRIYGHAAITTYREDYDVIYHGKHLVRSIIGTNTWVKQHGEWKLVAWHSSQVEKQGGI
jgi:hypothetical protein